MRCDMKQKQRCETKKDQFGDEKIMDSLKSEVSRNVPFDSYQGMNVSLNDDRSDIKDSAP